LVELIVADPQIKNYHQQTRQSIHINALPFFVLSFCIFITMKILVGSKNPVKIKAVEEAFSKYFDNIVVEGINVNSGVSVQPVNNETYAGAQNRALKLKEITIKKILVPITL